MTIESQLEQTNALLTKILAALSSTNTKVTPAVTQEVTQAVTPEVKQTPGPTARPAIPTDLNYDQHVKAPMMELARLKGRDAVAPIFAKFGVKNALGLTKDQWPAFIEAVAEAMDDQSIPMLVGVK